MTVFIANPAANSKALQRLRQALFDFAPESVEFVAERDAEMAVVPVIGRLDQVTRYCERFKSYAVIQLCLRSTQKPSTMHWLSLWQGARAVWSYYNLPLLCEDDGLNYSPFNFYRAPLGVSRQFKPHKLDKRALVCTTGPGWLVEGVRECAKAAQRLEREVVHLGPELNRLSVICVQGLADSELADVYAMCQYVSGLRRIEGFELPAAEGLLCGTRPILFEREHYRYWYGDWAEYIPEAPRAETVDALEALFRRAYRPVMPAEIKAARRLFDWQRSVTGFWEACA